MKDVLKCIVTTPGEQCVMTDSLTQQHELSAALLDSGTSRLYFIGKPFILFIRLYRILRFISKCYLNLCTHHVCERPGILTKVNVIY